MVSDRPPTPLLQKSDSTCDARTGNCEPAATPPAASSHSSRRLHTPTLASTTRSTLSHSGSGRGSESHRLGAVAVGGPPVLANLAAPLVATGASGGSFFCPTGGADPLWDDLFFTTPSFGTMSDAVQARPRKASRTEPLFACFLARERSSVAESSSRPGSIPSFTAARVSSSPFLHNPNFFRLPTFPTLSLNNTQCRTPSLPGSL